MLFLFFILFKNYKKMEKENFDDIQEIETEKKEIPEIFVNKKNSKKEKRGITKKRLLITAGIIFGLIIMIDFIVCSIWISSSFSKKDFNINNQVDTPDVIVNEGERHIYINNTIVFPDNFEIIIKNSTG